MAVSTGTSILINDNEVTGYSEYSVVNTRTKVAEPQRTITGSIANINEIDEFIVTTIHLKFNYMPLEDYRNFLSWTSDKEFSVTYYDIDTDKQLTKYFYIAPAEKTELFWKNGVARAVVSFNVELISTNN